jgi:flagellar motor switch/type III secretory pathway protein FliN
MSAQDLSKAISEAVAEAWSMLFSKNVGLSSDDISVANNANLPSEGSFVSCQLSFSGDISGSTEYLVAKTDALTMVGMMLSMGADDALIDSTREGELGAEELDALKEAFNQLSSTTATILRDQLSCTVNVELGELEAIELSDTPEGFGEGDQVSLHTLSLEGYDDGTLFQIFDGALIASYNNENEPVHESAPTGEKASGSGVDIEALAGLTVSADLILAERTMDFKNLLNLAVGSVIEFWKPCDNPADLCIKNTPIANGEVVLCQNQHFGIRVLNLAPERKVYQKGAQ